MKRASAGLLLILSAALAQAQSEPTQPTTVGVVAGINLAKLAGDDISHADTRIGFLGGVTLSLPMAPQWSFAPELTYSTKGVKDSDGTFTSTVKLSYVEIPALIRFDAATSGGVKPFLLGGPALAFKAGCSIETHESGVTATVDCDKVGGTSFNAVDVGAMFGGGLAFDAGGRTMRLGVRYDFGFIDIESNGSARNRVLSFVGSYEWPFRK